MMDRLGLILQMRGADPVLEHCRFRFWNLWLRYWRTVPKAERARRVRPT